MQHQRGRRAGAVGDELRLCLALNHYPIISSASNSNHPYPPRLTRSQMAQLKPMPPLNLAVANLLPFGLQWQANGSALSRTPPHSSMQLGAMINAAVGSALAEMLGGIPVERPRPTSLLPSKPDCVEVGEVRIVGGVRPQNFDVGYRPDGVRFALDSKTLNDRVSVGKNYQNMLNDLATEATTVHVRFPNAVVAFVVAVPGPCLVGPTSDALIARLEGLSGRTAYNEPSHLAEALALIVWNPMNGTIEPDRPKPSSALRV